MRPNVKVERKAAPTSTMTSTAIEAMMILRVRVMLPSPGKADSAGAYLHPIIQLSYACSHFAGTTGRGIAVTVHQIRSGCACFLLAISNILSKIGIWQAPPGTCPRPSLELPVPAARCDPGDQIPFVPDRQQQAERDHD